MTQFRYIYFGFLAIFPSRRRSRNELFHSENVYDDTQNTCWIAKWIKFVFNVEIVFCVRICREYTPSQQRSDERDGNVGCGDADKCALR